MTCALPAPFANVSSAPDLERWMDPQNAAPCGRSTGSAFAIFGDDAGVDTRHAQPLVTQCTAFDSSATGERNAQAASWSTNGTWVDVSNNVGRTNAAFAAIEAVPFAVGQPTDVLAGDLVPAGAKFTFELNFAAPFMLG